MSPQGVPEPPLTPVSAHSDHPALHGAVHWPRDQVQVGAGGLGVEMGLPWGGCPPADPPLTASPPFPPRGSGTLSAFATIYREEGILGFFA